MKQTLLGKYTTCILCCCLFWSQWPESVKAKVKNLNVTILTGNTAGSTERPLEKPFQEIWCDGYVWITENSRGETEVYINDYQFSKDPADLVVFSEIAYMNQGLVDASTVSWSDMQIHISATSSTSTINVRMDGGHVGKIDLGSDAPSGGINLEITGGSFYRYLFTGDVNGPSNVVVRNCNQYGEHGVSWKGKGADQLTLHFDKSVTVNYPRFIYEDLMPLKTKGATLDLPFKPNANGVYEIHDVNDFYWFEAYVDEYINDIDAILLNDIQIEKHTMIGSVESPYMGVFDGQGHTISGLNLGLYVGTFSSGDFRYQYAGLFGFVQGASAAKPAIIKNLTVEGEVQLGIFRDNANVDRFILGGVVALAYQYVKVEDVVSKVNITQKKAGGDSPKTHIGGVVGSTEYAGHGSGVQLSVDRCIFAGTITTYGWDAAGGIVGYMKQGHILDCLNAGTLTTMSASSDSWICGILGYINDGTKNFEMRRCLNVGTVTGNASNDKAYALVFPKNCQTSSFSDLYYLEGSAPASYRNSSFTIDASSLKSCTSSQLAKGEIAYKLNGSTSSNTTWRQNIGKDPYPAPDLNKRIVVYSNGSYCNTLAKDGDYCLIAKMDDLVDFAQMVNAGQTEAKAKLTADIVLNQHVLNADGSLNGTPSLVWTPIGSKSKPFAGIFDGQGHTISGLYVPATDNNIGLFGYNSNAAVVRNVILSDSYIQGNDYVGGICGYNYGTISNCANFATVVGKSSTASAGGICGRSSGKGAQVERCYNAGKIKASGSYASSLGEINSSAQFINCCYLEGTNSLGTAQGSSNTVFKCTADEFANGVAAWKLNGDQTTIAWYQTIGADTYPVLYSSHKVVYRTYADCYAKSPTYSNKNVGHPTQGHNHVDGFCSYCNDLQTDYVARINGWYEISNAKQLVWFSAYVNGGNPSANAKLTANIAATNRNWIPVGTSDAPYIGTFDGQGFTISGLNCNDAALECAGLFGKTGATALIKHLTLSDCLIGGGKYTGGICGWNGGTLQNCFNQNTTVSGKNAGGICGRNSGTISNCLSTGNVSLKK